MKEWDRMKNKSPFVKRLMDIVVIVGSILLAFSIDAGWNARKENIREKEVLTAIKQDMEANLQELERVITWSESKDSAIQIFFKSSGSELVTVPDDSSLKIIMDLLLDVTFTPFYGSLSSPNLSIIKDLNLRNELSSWLGQSSDVVENGPIQIEGGLQLLEKAGFSGALLTLANVMKLPIEPPLSGRVLSRLRNNKEFINSLLKQHTVRTVTVQKVYRLNETTERLLERLNRD